MVIYRKHMKHINSITLSQRYHFSLSMSSIVYTRDDLGREHSILQLLALTCDVCQVCHCVVPCVKNESSYSSSMEWKSIHNIDGISYYLNKC